MRGDNAKYRKHEDLLWELHDRLHTSKIQYEFILTHVEYSLGEIDVVAKYRDRLLLFEVKGSCYDERYVKGSNQLHRAEKNKDELINILNLAQNVFGGKFRVSKFIYNPKGLELIL
jgi:Holliday junction resolvase-like predicted endonuclease